MTKRQGRPPTLANRTDLHISVSADLRERLRAESLRTGESEAEIGRQALERELSRRGPLVSISSSASSLDEILVENNALLAGIIRKRVVAAIS